MKLLILTFTLGISQVVYSTVFFDKFTDILSKNVTKTSKSRAVSNRIPGTELRTGVYYKLSLRTFPHGVVTWTSSTSSFLTNRDWNYVQVRQEGSAPMTNYEPGGSYYNDVQFMFLPSYVPGYYEIINRALPNKKLVVSRFYEGDQGYYLALDSDAHDRPQADSLFKPVKVEQTNLKSCKDTPCRYYYQLQSLSVADGAVTYAMSKYGMYAYYVIINDPLKDKMNKFKPGGDWYKHTFLLFETVTQ